MKLTIDKATLAAALALPTSIAKVRNTMPILACVKLSAEDGRLTIEATDLEISVRQTADCQVATKGAVCLDGRLLGQIVGGLSGAEVSIEVGAKLKTVLKSGGGKFSLNGFAADDMPTVKTVEHDAKEATVSAADLAKAFGAVEHCMSTDEARYNLNGLCLKPLMTQTVVAATDGHRLAKTTGPVLTGLSARTVAIVPRVGVERILDYLTAADECVAFLDGDALHLTRPDCSLSVRLIDGSFPDYEKVIPSSGAEAAIDVVRSAMTAAVKRVMLVCTDRTKAVRLDVGTDAVKVTGQSPEYGEASDEVECDVTGKPGVVGVSGRYLLDALAAVEGERVRIEVRGEVGPIVIRGSDESDLVQVVMPLRFEQR